MAILPVTWRVFTKIRLHGSIFRLLPGSDFHPRGIPQNVLSWWAEHRGWLQVVCAMHGELARVDASRDPRMLGIAWDAAVIEVHARDQRDWLHSFDEPEYEGADCWPRITTIVGSDHDDLLEVLPLGLHFEGPWPWWIFQLVSG